jgi:outer membrane protein assembly factor BamB
MTNFFLLSFLCLGLLAWPSEVDVCYSGYSFAYCRQSQTLYLVSGGVISAVDSTGGQLRWQKDLENEFVHAGPVATGHSLSLVTGAIAETIHGLDLRTGENLWKVPSKTTDLLTAGSYLLANTNEWEGVMAIDSKTGKVVWRHSGETRSFINLLAASPSILLTNLFSLDVRSGNILKRWPRGYRVTSAAFMDQAQVLGTSDGRLVTYASDGRRMWEKMVFSGLEVSAIVGGQDRVVAVSYDPCLFIPGKASLALLSSTGEVVWDKHLEVSGRSLPRPVAITDQLVVFVRHDRESDRILGLDLASGNLRWDSDSRRQLREGIVCVGDSCFVGSNEGVVVTVDVQSGMIREIPGP